VIFKIYDCEFGIKYNGVSYEFTHVNEMTIEDPENTKLVRGSNAGNKLGLIYKEGIKEPKRITCKIMGMSIDLKAVLDQAYDNRDRLDVYCISRVDGSSKMAKNAVLSQMPQQLSIAEGAESMDVSLAFESFDLSEVHKT
jgi:hypothetical protein